jgi:hypothetical protein
MFTNTSMGGMNTGFPDTCTTPGVAAGAPAPLPYPNMANGPTGTPPALKVLCMGCPAHNQLTTIPMSNGDNAGVLLGVASGLVMGPSRYNLGCVKTFMGGTPAQRLCSVTGHNGATMNVPGASLVPAQCKVLTLA